MLLLKSPCHSPSSHVSHWGSDAHTGMAYSFLPVGSSGQVYSDLSVDLESKVFFAGEATHQQFPQSVTGAYLSGVREARRVLAVIEKGE